MEGKGRGNSNSSSKNNNPQFWQYKIFIGGIPIGTTEKNLFDLFSPFGEILDLVIIKDKATGRPRGFGFITFKLEQSFESVLAEEHFVGEKRLDLKKALPREQNGKAGKALPKVEQATRKKHNPPKRTRSKRSMPAQKDGQKLFVGGLPKDLTLAEFREYFDQYGEIVDIAVISDKKTKEPRGFGFVTFKTRESTRKVLDDYKQHSFKGKWVECKEALPRNTEDDSHSEHPEEPGSTQQRRTRRSLKSPPKGAKGGLQQGQAVPGHKAQPFAPRRHPFEEEAALDGRSSLSGYHAHSGHHRPVPPPQYAGAHPGFVPGYRGPPLRQNSRLLDESAGEEEGSYEDDFNSVLSQPRRFQPKYYVSAMSNSEERSPPYPGRALPDQPGAPYGMLAAPPPGIMRPQHSPYLPPRHAPHPQQYLMPRAPVGYEKRPALYYSRTYSTNIDSTGMGADIDPALPPRAAVKRNSIDMVPPPPVAGDEGSIFTHPEYQQPFQRPIRSINTLRSNSYLLEHNDIPLKKNPRVLKSSKTNYYE